MSGNVQNGTPFPPPGPTTLQAAIPSYLYAQYKGDDALQAFVDAQNVMANEWVRNLNALNLPVWSQVFGSLLDWVGAGLYGYPRPTLTQQTIVDIGGPYNSTPYNTQPYNGVEQLSDTTFVPVTDDIYQRMLTWHLYLGDGWQFTTRWLKQRVHRFLNGPNGTSADNQNTRDVSVTWSGRSASINLATGGVSQILKYAIADGVLALPFQYNFTVMLH